MKIRILAFLLIWIVIPIPSFAMGGPPSVEVTPVEAKKAEGTSSPFSISIDQPSISMISEPGSAQSGKITVSNNGSRPLNIKVYTADWTYEKDGSKAFYEAGSTKYSCANWIHIYPKDLILEPLEARDVEYVITTPKGANGGHVAVIFFEGVFEEKQDIVIGGRIGSIVYHEAKGSIKKTGNIVKFDIKPNKNEKDTADIEATFKNTGNSNIIVAPVIELYSKDGQKLDEITMPDIKTLPGDSVMLKEHLFIKKYDPPVYKAAIKMDLGDRTLEKTASFSL